VSTKIKRTGGGTFDPNEENIYFLASGTGRLAVAEPLYDHLLVAVNELENDGALDLIEQWCDRGKKVFIDSGIFHLTQQHAKAHGCNMDQALALPPDEIDGFGELLERYIAIYRRLGDKCWGFIELDQGGRENKIKTRAKLEGMGLNPIPVYHPFNDGWDYFDYLAERYDRICFGNVVQADRATRKHLVATAWERHRKYPNLWIHLLGLTPNEWLNAMPINSGDSSSWLVGVRWADSHKARCAGKTFSSYPLNFRYELGSDAASPVGADKAVALAAYESRMNMLNWRHYLNAFRELGCELYPSSPTKV
jgi:hypothetical protein